MHQTATTTMALSIAVPTAAILLGCLIATLRAPTAEQSSIIKHFTAGVMFGAAGVDVLPDLLHRTGVASAVRISIGIAIGVAAMLAIRALSSWLTTRLQDSAKAKRAAPPKRTPKPMPQSALPLTAAGPSTTIVKRAESTRANTSKQNRQGSEEDEQESSDQDAIPFSLIGATAVDVLLDGVTLGVVYTLGGQKGILITIALGLEIFFLGISIGGELSKQGTSRAKALAYAALPALTFAGGGILGVTVFATLSSAVLEVIITAGLVALLYLATEELLTEAHEAPETSLTTVIFFVGFLVILLYAILSGASRN